MKYRSSEVLHLFVDDRTSIAYLTRRDVSLFHSSLGLAQTDVIWFQVALCLRAAHCCFQRLPYFQETCLHHRQSVLNWLKDNFDGKKTAISAPYLSVIAAMIISDVALDDEFSVQVHLKAILSLLDARKQKIRDWRFYDSLVKRIIIMELWIAYLLRQDQLTDISGDESLDRSFAALYGQMLNEFLRVPVYTGSPHTASRTDGPILFWLYNVLRQTEYAGPSRQDTSDRLEFSTLDRKEEQIWLKTVSAYTLTVGCLDWGDPSPGSSVTPELHQLREWWDSLMQTWVASNKPMTHKIAQDIWKKIKWLETDEGLRVIHEIAVEAQRSEASWEGNPTTDWDSLDLATGLLPSIS
ncbi:hypothetical protein GQ53DRAFT_820261 [Thozetella sp. PMI_491]|nr:hypothetical protein GQ53DRAFT_820261 [Thozetella sp. PMI_491]